MGYYIGNCPNCGARLIVEYEKANNYFELDLSSSHLEITYIVKCWKCNKIVEATIWADIDEFPLKINLVPEDIGKRFVIIETRNLREEKNEE
jgi:DNA-directed RNA polymerase subunit RPC12/RpoP